MDARMWHRQALTENRPLPTPLALKELDTRPAPDQDAYSSELSAALLSILAPSVMTQRATKRLTALVIRNDLRPPGAKSVIGVNAPFAIGKSTFVKTWAHQKYRDRVGQATQDALPTWSAQPEVTADWVPQIYITLRAASKIKDLNAAILAFLGYPSEGLVRVTTTRVVKVLATHGVQLLIVDDAHMLKTTHADGRDVLDYLKFLNTELGELGGTMILVGAHLEGGPLYQDPQIVGRLDKISFGPYEITTPAGRRDWQQFLFGLEELCIPYVDTLASGIFAREHAGLIWRRTQGYVSDTVTLLVRASLNAFEDDEALTRHSLEKVPLSARAAAAEADMVTSASGASSRRTRKQQTDAS